MMPLWLEFEDFEEEESETLAGKYCEVCFEPLACCHCGYSWNEDEDDYESEDEDE